MEVKNITSKTEHPSTDAMLALLAALLVEDARKEVEKQPDKDAVLIKSGGN